MPHVPLATFGIADTPCIHCSDTSLAAPVSSAIDKDDCAYCCHTNAHGAGLMLCMHCKEAMCYDHVEKHTALFPGHALYVKYYRLPDRVKEGEAVDDLGANDAQDAPFVSPTGDVNAIGIVDPPAYDARCVCVPCQTFFTNASAAVVGPSAAQGYTVVVHATPKAAVAAASSGDVSNNNGGDADDPYRNSIICKHTRDLAQLPSPFGKEEGLIPMPADPATLQCVKCPCAKNNWICMTCGAVGCPRKEGGGNEHAIAHYKETGHPVVLKLGTVTTKGADMYCYACDEEVKDPGLRAHLAHFGIDQQTAVKTSKSLGEMMYDLTMAADFSAICEIGEDGKSLVVPALGRSGGFMGLHNFGNTCYMNAVVQLLMRSGPFQKAFLAVGADDVDAEQMSEEALVAARNAHTAACTSTSPRQCFACQWHKVASALYSKRYADTLAGHVAGGSNGVADAMVNADYTAEEAEKGAMYADFVANVLPADPSARMDKSLLPRKARHDLHVLNGATPRDFKTLNARGNKEFLGGQQQDALEYLGHLFDGIQQQEAKGAPLTTAPLAPFALESVNKKQCILCQRVKYQRTRETVLRLPTPMHSEEYIAEAAKLAAAAAAKDAEAAQTTSGAKPTAPERPRVDMSALLESYVAPKMTECKCESCGATDGGYFCSSNIYNFPEYVLLSVPREYVDPTTYTAKKMDVYVNVPSVIDLAMLKGPGNLQPGEEPLASHVEDAVERGGLSFVDGAGASPAAPSQQRKAEVVVDELALVQLLSMGIEQPTAEWALRKVGNNVELAIDYVFSHPEGPSFDDAPAPAAVPEAPAAPAAATPLSALTDSTTTSTYDVIGMVSHVGASAVTGHYVCHLRKADGAWYLYNDEKVGKSVKPPLDLGTFYLLKRQQ